MPGLWAAAILQDFFILPAGPTCNFPCHSLDALGGPTDACTRSAAPAVRRPTDHRPDVILLLGRYPCFSFGKTLQADRVYHLGTGAHVGCVISKGRNERGTPLAGQVRAAMQSWLKEPPRSGALALFPTIHGGCLSLDAIQFLLAKHGRTVRAHCRIAHRCSKNGYRRTSFGAPPRWNCSGQVSTCR